MVKVALVGAGSAVFAQRQMFDEMAATQQTYLPDFINPA